MFIPINTFIFAKNQSFMDSLFDRHIELNICRPLEYLKIQVQFSFMHRLSLKDDIFTDKKALLAVGSPCIGRSDAQQSYHRQIFF